MRRGQRPNRHVRRVRTRFGRRRVLVNARVRKRRCGSLPLWFRINFGSLSLKELGEALKGSFASVDRDSSFSRFEGVGGTHTLFKHVGGGDIRDVKRQFGVSKSGVYDVVNEEGRPAQLVVKGREVVVVNEPAVFEHSGGVPVGRFVKGERRGLSKLWWEE